MKVNFSENFYLLLDEIVDFIALDKPIAARKFKNDLLINLKSDLKNPYHFKKSIYADDLTVRDYVFKGYTITYKVYDDKNYVNVVGIIKNKNNY